MASIKRAAAAVAAILVREGVDYAQSKAVFKAARERAGLCAPHERRGGVDRLTVEEELRFLDQAYAQDGRTGLMLQVLLETGARASELVQLRVEDVSLAGRVVTIRHGKGDKRREVPIRRDLAQLLQLHIGARRAGPLFASRQQGSGPTPHVLKHFAYRLGRFCPCTRVEVLMAGAYSKDLRSRVLAVVEAGESVEAAAKRFAVARSTAYR